ncbi:MAG TPA: hypothetical protein VHM26_10865, partial [Chitinophagaceae bacterium]|nr:hypothetical protein [Chitinophagaceae bacterium]
MMKLIMTLLACCLLSSHPQAQKKIEVSIPEVYELSNIILALTDYGKADEWEVQKRTNYYNDVINYFEPVKAHPL